MEETEENAMKDKLFSQKRQAAQFDTNFDNFGMGRCILEVIVSALLILTVFVSIIDATIKYPTRGFEFFRYFTVFSNLISGVAAIMVIPFVYEGIKKHQFFVPGWVVRILYCGTVCTTITFMVVMCFIWPTQGDNAVSGYNFTMHIIVPILSSFLFYNVSGKRLRIKDAFLILIPVALYAACYIIFVFYLGDSDLGWDDMYKVRNLLPPWVLILILAVISISISFANLLVRNSLQEKREKKILGFLTDNIVLPEDADIKLQIYEYGKSVMMKGYSREITVPLDFITAVANRFPSVSDDELVNCYVRGAMSAFHGKTK